MRISHPRQGPTIGLTTLMHEATVLELDAGFDPTPLLPSTRNDHGPQPTPSTFTPSPIALHAIHSSMVIIIPCKNEDPTTLLGVLRGIPAACTILLVSASDPLEYTSETTLLEDFCRPGSRRSLALHQRDPIAASALSTAGMAPLLFDNDGAVRAGKGEGMILGLAVAMALFPEARYVGFLDADAKMPGAPHEYCRAYAAGFAAEPGDDVMVRIHWGSKPKPREDGSGGLDFGVAEGRSSRIVNEWLNRFVRVVEGGGEERVVTTGNAGEHAMTMSLARKLRFAGGYAIEPFHFVDLFSRQLRAPAMSGFSSPGLGKDGAMSPVEMGPGISIPMARTVSEMGDDSGPSSSASSVRSMATLHSSAASCSTSNHGDDVPLERSPVCVVQIKTINPHIHRETDEAHVEAMWKMGLGTIYHHLLPEFISSPFVERDVADELEQLRAEMEAFVEERNGEVGGMEERAFGEPLLPKPRLYSELDMVDMGVLRRKLELGGGSLVRIGC